MCSAIGAIGEGVLTNRIRLCILDMSGGFSFSAQQLETTTRPQKEVEKAIPSLLS